jgi:hypothetical protein
MLHIICNTDVQSTEWLKLNQVTPRGQKSFHINEDNNLLVGINALANRLHSINDKIPFKWLTQITM